MKRFLILFSSFILFAFTSPSLFDSNIINTWIIKEYELPGESAEMQKIMDALVVEMRKNTYLKFSEDAIYEFYSEGQMDRGTYIFSEDGKVIELTNKIRKRIFNVEVLTKKLLIVNYYDPTKQTIRITFEPAPSQEKKSNNFFDNLLQK